jgi:hypothetical protein
MRFGSRLQRWVLVVGLVLGAAVVASAQTQQARATQLAQFTTAGTYRWVVPAGVTQVRFDVYGGSGGNVAEGNVRIANGGAGGHTRAVFPVTPGQAFEIVVGGRGANGDLSGTPAAGGANGGGVGGPATSGYVGGAGGGGASDVRIGGRGNLCVKYQNCQVNDRIIVAGGGGGAVDFSGVYGGAGGGVTGGYGGAMPGYITSSPGNQVAGGSGENQPTLALSTFGSFGQGGDGDAVHDTPPPAGGGGGGWWGGGAFSYAGGSGGSGYVNALSVSWTFQAANHYGDGSVTITTV